MKYRVRTLRRADADIRGIAHYISERSQQGACSWLDACEAAISRLSEFADGCAQCDEHEQFEIDVRQLLFKTRNGRTYRIVFTIVDNEVRILRVRGPGQAPITPDDV